MKIVFLDGYTLNPGDLNWTELQSLGNCTIYDRTPANKIIERSAGAEIILTNKVPLNEETIAQLPKLKYIGVTATGFNVVDVAAAKKRNIVVTNVRNYATHTVAQAVFSLLFELTNRVGHHSETVRNGKWSKSDDWCYWDFPLTELAGKNFGIVGFGNIGQAVATIAQALGMNVIVSTRSPERFAGREISFVSIEELFSRSDVVSLHCPLTDETKHLVNSRTIALMKRTSFLINTSRGGLIDEPTLAEALNNGRIAGAGLDVLTVEPPSNSNPLLNAKNCIITPHIAWASQAARQRLLESVVGNIRSFLAGQPVNVVS